MRIIFIVLCISLFSCGQNKNSDKELELREKELALKQKELELKERGMNQDSISSINNTSNTGTTTATLTTDEMVAEIRNEFARINSLKTTTKRYKFVCDAEGTVDYYWENNKVVRVAIDWGFLGDYASKSEYYYKEGKFIFGYEVSVGGPGAGPETTTEHRTYVNNDKTIKAMENNKTIACITCHFGPSSLEYKIVNADNAKKVTAVLCE